MARHALSFLAGKGFTVERIYAGTFLSSLDMAGISISVLGLNDDRLRLLDAPTAAPAWPNVMKQPPGKVAAQIVPEARCAGQFRRAGRAPRRARKPGRRLRLRAGLCWPPKASLPKWIGLPATATWASAWRGRRGRCKRPVASYPLDDVAATLKALGHTLRRELGGSSGPLYGVLFLRCGSVLDSTRATGLAKWAEALDQGCRAISELGGAKPGDRTMLDALDPFVKTLHKDILGGAPRQSGVGRGRSGGAGCRSHRPNEAQPGEV